jgi:class 3 adenylate cyclase
MHRYVEGRQLACTIDRLSDKHGDDDGPVLPMSSLTFLMTDIVGSTVLWEQHEAVMRLALARHDALVDETIRAHGGQQVRERGEGDSIFAVFAHATNAVTAAVDIMQALQNESWPPTTPLRVRLALHTGLAQARHGDYYGPIVNRCARIRSLAHGGQILASQTVATSVQRRLPPLVALRALGTVTLRGVDQPEMIYQVVHPSLVAQFPPLGILTTVEACTLKGGGASRKVPSCHPARFGGGRTRRSRCGRHAMPRLRARGG